MTTVDDLDLPLFDIFAPGSPATFPDAVAQLRAGGAWLMRTPLGVSVIDHDAVRDLLRDTRLHTPGTRLLEMQGVTSGPTHEGFSRSLLNLEGEEHTRLRRLVSRAFTPRVADRLRPMMRAWVDERARAMASRGGGDLMTEVAEAYPIAVICELLGTPKEDWPRLSAWANAIFRIFNMNLAADLPGIEAAEGEMRAHVVDLIAQRRPPAGGPQPTVGPDDLLSELLRVEEEGDRLTHQELCDLVFTLFLAGTDTTRNQLGLAVGLLARHPDQWERLVADPALVPRAVEEALRFDPAIAATPRVAVEDVTYRDVTFPAGTFVSLVTAAANRDPARVECPMRFDVGAVRDSWAPLTFGSGAHHCLGASLARAELQEALGVLALRWRRVELTEEPEMKPYVGVYGPVRLAIRVEARTGAETPADR